ncbi:MAG: hypothetical protein AABY22_28885 [Nanoarchaeota archaeon]
MFDAFSKPKPQIQKPKPQGEGCIIKVGRDKSGRVKSVTTNGKCNKEELSIFKDNLKDIEESDWEE